MKPFEFQPVVGRMSEARSKPISVDSAEERGGGKSRQQQSSTVKVASEVVGHVEPPPDAIEPDPELTPEQAEQARKQYLLRRFWISARGYWSRRGDRLA